MSGSGKLVPLISTNATGPAGIKHLPRLWLKIRLAAAGRLEDEYRHGSGGFDSHVCERFGVDPAAFTAYVENERPDYLTAERWFVEHGDVSPERVAAWSAFVDGMSFPDPERARLFRDRAGVADETLTRAVPLNDFDDWFGMHEILLR